MRKFSAKGHSAFNCFIRGDRRDSSTEMTHYTKSDIQFTRDQLDDTTIWLMGRKISLTKKPRKPTAKNPTAVRRATLRNSFLSGFLHLLISLAIDR